MSASASKKVYHMNPGDLVYEPAPHMLYVGAARAAKLTVARADANGHLAMVVRLPTHEGARNAAVAKNGTVYLAHGSFSQLSALIVASPSKN